MRARLALVGASAAAFAAAVPANAMLLPYCAATLSGAASGASTSCSVATPQTLQGDPYRSLTLTVVQGTVYAVLHCPYAETSLTLTGPDSATTQIPDAGGTCRVTITALSGPATATAATVPGRRPPDAL